MHVKRAFNSPTFFRQALYEIFPIPNTSVDQVYQLPNSKSASSYSATPSFLKKYVITLSWRFSNKANAVLNEVKSSQYLQTKTLEISLKTNLTKLKCCLQQVTSGKSFQEMKFHHFVAFCNIS